MLEVKKFSEYKSAILHAHSKEDRINKIFNLPGGRTDDRGDVRWT